MSCTAGTTRDPIEETVTARRIGPAGPLAAPRNEL